MSFDAEAIAKSYKYFQCNEFILNYLIFFVLLTKKIIQFKNKHEERKISNKVAHGFLYWRKLTFLRKITEYRNKKRQNFLLLSTFSTWKKNLSFLKQFHWFQKKKIENLIVKSFFLLKKYSGLQFSKENTKVRKFRNFNNLLL